MNQPVIIDAGPVVALVNARDTYHAAISVIIAATVSKRFRC
ncbi:MAG: hypothetical protein WCK89_05960 [bacterium]